MILILDVCFFCELVMQTKGVVQRDWEMQMQMHLQGILNNKLGKGFRIAMVLFMKLYEQTEVEVLGSQWGGTTHYIFLSSIAWGRGRNGRSWNQARVIDEILFLTC